MGSCTDPPDYKTDQVTTGSKAREENKKSILSRLSEEQAALFRLVSAKDWDDKELRLNSFTQRLVTKK